MFRKLRAGRGCPRLATRGPPGPKLAPAKRGRIRARGPWVRRGWRDLAGPARARRRGGNKRGQAPARGSGPRGGRRSAALSRLRGGDDSWILVTHRWATLPTSTNSGAAFRKRTSNSGVRTPGTHRSQERASRGAGCTVAREEAVSPGRHGVTTRWGSTRRRRGGFQAGRFTQDPGAAFPRRIPAALTGGDRSSR